jgi:hypothetical protein
MKMTESIVLYGKIDKTPNVLSNLYEYGKGIFHTSGLEITHLGITGSSFTGGKVTTYKRTERRLIDSIKGGEIISNITLYSLPENFHQAAFDYLMTFSINVRKDEHFIHLCMLSKISKVINKSKVISELKGFIDFNSGEVFQMNVADTPYFYAAKANPPASFRSLKVIESF